MAYSSTASLSAARFSLSGPPTRLNCCCADARQPNWRTSFISLTGNVLTASAACFSAASCSGVPSGLAVTVCAVTAMVSVVEWVAEAGAEEGAVSRLAAPSVDTRASDCAGGSTGSGFGVLAVVEAVVTETVRRVAVVSTSVADSSVAVAAECDGAFGVGVFLFFWLGAGSSCFDVALDSEPVLPVL